MIFIPKCLNRIQFIRFSLSFHPNFPCTPVKHITMGTYNSNRIIASGGRKAKILHMRVGF